ncbi:MAG: TRAP transporter substrate-binding protein DctP, partial [Faecousia sp.]
MKKWFSLLLAAVMLSLAACGTTAPGGAASSGTTAPTTVPTTTAQTTEAAPSLRLTIAYTQAEDSLPGRGAAAFSEKLAELSDENLTCTLLAGGTLGTDAEVTAMLQSAKCDLSVLPVSSLTELCPELGVLGLPFLFESYQEARELLDAEAGRMLTESLAASGLHSLGWMTTGFRQVTANQAITTPAEFQGLAIYTQQDELHQAVFQALGAVPTAVNADELHDALEQGVVDGQEDTYLNISRKDLSRVQSHVMETNHVLEL